MNTQLSLTGFICAFWPKPVDQMTESVTALLLFSSQSFPHNFRTSFWWNCIFIALILRSSTGPRYCVLATRRQFLKKESLTWGKSFSVTMVFALMSQDSAGYLLPRSSTSTRPEEQGSEMLRLEKDVRGEAASERWRHKFLLLPVCGAFVLFLFF